MKDISYYRTIGNSLNSTTQESEKYEAQRALLYDFDSNPSCKTVLLNNIITNVITWVGTDIVTGGQSLKIMVKPDVDLKIGDVLVIDNESWFVTKVEWDRMITRVGTLAKTTCYLKFYKNNTYYEIPCYITVGTRNYLNKYYNDYMTYPKSLYTAYCPDIGILNQVEDADRRFIIKNMAYITIGIDNLTVIDDEVRDGLLTIKLQTDGITDDDNLELGIANYYSAIGTNNSSNDKVNNNSLYSISISPTDGNISIGESIYYTVNVTNNDKENVDLSCNFTITNENDDIIKYATLNIIDGQHCSLYIPPNVKYIGKIVKLTVTLSIDNSVSYEKYLTINGIT